MVAIAGIIHDSHPVRERTLGAHVDIMGAQYRPHSYRQRIPRARLLVFANVHLDASEDLGLADFGRGGR
jgi:hypothetical protein